MFRNETQATERRAQRSINTKKLIATVAPGGDQRQFSSESEDTTSAEDEDTDSLITPTSTVSSSSVAVPRALQVPVDQQALCFFLANYVYLPAANTQRGYHDFLIPLLKTEKPGSQLIEAFQAVALASLANRPNSKGSDLMSQAVSHYAKALKVTNIALQTPALQKSDATLASIILLGFFEVCKPIPQTGNLLMGR